jgi:phosphoglucosamine mutase
VSPNRRLFGTDGIRARFGEAPLERATVTALAFHLAAHLGARSGGRPLVLLGGDTRESTPEICRWLAAGLAAGGAVVRYAGVIPTPGVAWLTRELGAAAGAVVSASHNPYPDNGIKLIDPHGLKWSEDEEAALERRLESGLAAPVPDTEPEPAAEPELRELYLSHLATTLDGDRALDGLKIVLDTGNGAASSYAGKLFERLGAQVTPLHAAPDGRNVNAGCGSTSPEEMAARVVAEGAHLGAAFDGDADRCILADERGQVRDGDAILYLWATDLLSQGRLDPPRIVATTMSNLGLERALAREGIGIERCDVGDRAVVETMARAGIVLGGEQSGHIVQGELTSTGDGLLTALQMARLARPAGPPLSQRLAGFRRYPQVLKNVRVARKPDLATLPRVAATARDVEKRLGADGRLVLRYSGTEPLARVMIEGPDQPTIDALAGELANVIAEELAAG